MRTILSAGPEATQQACSQHSGHAGYAPVLTQYPSFALPQVCTDDRSLHVLVGTLLSRLQIAPSSCFPAHDSCVVNVDSMKLLSC